MNIGAPTSFTLFMLACLLSPTPALSAELEPYNVKISANFSLPDLNGKIHALPDYKDKVVLLTFWASWCLPCLKEMPSMSRLADTLIDENFAIVAINITDPPGRIRETLKRLHLDLPVLQDPDSKTFKAWQGRILPTSYLLDHTGQVRYRVIGSIDWDDADVALKVKQLIRSQ